MTNSAMGVVPGSAFGRDGRTRRGGYGTWRQARERAESEQAVAHRLASAGKAPKDAGTSTGV